MHIFVVFIAQYFIILAVIFAGYCFLMLPAGDKKKFIVDALIGGIVALVLAKVGSALFNDPRPFVVGHFTPYFPHSNDNGFPSDHTLLASFLGFLVLRYNKVWGIVLLVLAALIGGSRVIAGVHHPIDIIGSFVFAGVGMLVAYFVSEQIKKKRARLTSPVADR